MKQQRARTERLLESVPFVAAIMIPGLFALYVKYCLLNNYTTGYLVLSRFLDRNEQGAAAFSILERLSLYREDIFLNILLISVTLLFLLAFIRGKSRLVITATIAVCSIFFYFQALLSYANVGTFLNSQMAKDALQWGIGHPDDFFSYVSPSSLLKLAMLIIFSIALAVLAYKTQRNNVINKWMRGAVYLALFFGLIGFVVGNVKTLPLPKVYKSIGERVISTFFQSADKVDAYAKMDYAALHAEFVKEFSEVGQSGNELFGFATGRNVVVVVLETAPARGIDLAAETRKDGSLPSLGGAIIGNRHFSTYPYTSDAHFSIFSSQYPLARTALLSASKPIQTIGWPDVLRSAGYETRLFYPGPSMHTPEHDDLMYSQLGFKDQYISNDKDNRIWEMATSRATTLLQSFTGEFSERDRKKFYSLLQYDIAALERMKLEIKKLHAERKPFVTAFMPMVGHGPWFDIMGNENIFARGAALVKLQLAWTEELAHEMKADRLLENTIILIVGDHGLRTRAEYPELPEGVLTATSVNVPFLLYVDGLNIGASVIDYGTSHIDIGPSLLTLLGINDPRPVVHGINLWPQSKKSRRIYFFARDYLGADAYYQDGEIVSCEFFNETCQTMPFPDQSISSIHREPNNADLDTFKKIRALHARSAQLQTDGSQSTGKAGSLNRL